MAFGRSMVTLILTQFVAAVSVNPLERTSLCDDDVMGVCPTAADQVLPGPVTSGYSMVQLQKHQSSTASMSELEQLSSMDLELTSDLGKNNRSLDARFLIQATFGPTPSSLDELGQMTYQEWISEQLQLPLETHREYYRARVNPRYVKDGMEPAAEFVARPQCAAGSRWHSMAFLYADWGKSIKVEGKKIFVGGVFRSDVEEGPLPSRWSRFESYQGHVCSVEEALGAKVVLSTAANCGSNKVEMPNPSIWLANSSEAVSTFLVFNALKPGVLLLANDTPSCELAGADFMTIGGRVYLFDDRLELFRNTPESPSTGAEVCQPRNFLNERGCRVNPPGSRCVLACGSPGEVPNDPALGHQLPMVTRNGQAANMEYDNKYYRRLYSRLSKSTVWTMKAMQAKDQLRQRMAWALSQIFVASVPGVGDDGSSESWLTFYDIFVRNSFGSLRDVMREVTYSPIMGLYLTYMGSSSYDYNGKYPDENYAREIMQLFTIGVVRLNPNGTWQNSTDSRPLSTYDNEHITSFARVFTGFLGSDFRENVEVRNGADNRIDPMQMDARRHDVYPKMDLDGGYLGDGYPLCADIPKGSFLSKGAKYEFLGFTYNGEVDVFVAEADSLLYGTLCGHASGPCVFQPSIELAESIQCAGSECSMDTVEVIKVGDGFYEFIPPTCVHMFLYNGQGVAKGDHTFGGNRKCANPDTPVAGAACCGGCSDIPTGGMTNKYLTCSNYTWLHTQCNGSTWWVEKQWCQKSCFESGFGYGTAMEFANNCSTGDYRESRLCGRNHERMRIGAARELCRAQDMDVCPTQTSHPDAACNYQDMWVWLPSTCSIQLEVHVDGKVSAHTADGFHNRFPAQWLGAVASPGVYTVSVESQSIFTDIPRKEELKTKLKIGASPPMSPCHMSTSGVKVCSAVLSESTQYQDAVLASNPAVAWHLDEQSGSIAAAIDASGQAPSEAAGQYVQNPTHRKPGLAFSTRASVTFDGSQQQAVWIPNHVLINLGTYQQKTVELWFMVASLSSKRSVLWMQGGGTRGLSIYLDGSKLVVNAWNLKESYWGPVSVNTSIEAGLPYHVALVLDGNHDGNDSTNDGVLTGFLNGAPFGFASNAGVLRPHSGAVCIGCSRSGGRYADNSAIDKDNAYFSGTIDEVSVFNTALSSEIVRAHYEASFVTSNSTVIDSTTVFELAGKYYKNAQSVVTLNGTHKIRNPPVFMFSGAFKMEGSSANRAALAEVEALLDHLFYHNNTAPFISKKLIQRFVTSNPSANYVYAVAEAFRTGEYAGTSYSGKYGDLGATVAAILLHQDARAESNSTIQGSLREPLLKVIHFLRAMVYEENGMDHIVLDKMQDVIGQFPFQSPTVFNYFMPDFEPPRFAELLPQPEPEPEPEPVAPEFQIFTPPYFAGFLNGMTSLIHDGVTRSCNGRDGFGVHIEGSGTCQRGQLKLQEAGSVDATLDELDILLTGGRLTPKTRGLVRSVMEEAADGEQLQAAQQVVTLTPEFHTMGAPKPKDGKRQLNVSETIPAQHPYRATVMLFMFGGADTFNLLVPLDCGLYEEYRAVRDDVALKETELNGIDTPGKACPKFGIHAAMPNLKKLYDQGLAAFVSNIGALVKPLTRSEFEDGTLETCRGLFSHSHQQAAAQTLKCQEHGASPRGAGGRLADMLRTGSKQYKTMSFSLAGTSIWSQGMDTHTEIIDRDHGTVRFGEYERWRKVIGNITGQYHGNAYAEEYVHAFVDAIQSSESIGSALDTIDLPNYAQSSTLQKQLYQVARLIKARELRQAERDFFFVEIGGWDTHSNVKDVLQVKFAEVDAAIHGFVEELQVQGMLNSVVLLTESDFGRTLTSNGGGTDHGWSGNHMIIGGSISGGQIFNDYPSSLAEGNPQDAGRGRLIPKYPWESVMVPVAEWMGLELNQHNYVFPNLGNFNASLIIDKTSLFKATS